MSSDNKLIYAMLFILITILGGMFIGSWRLILYPYMIIIGICVFIGLAKAIKINRNLTWIPLVVTLVFIALYMSIDIITASSLDSESYVFGLVPSTAVLLLGIWPVVIFLSLIYGLTFSADSTSFCLPSENINQEKDQKI